MCVTVSRHTNSMYLKLTKIHIFEHVCIDGEKIVNILDGKIKTLSHLDQNYRLLPLFLQSLSNFNYYLQIKCTFINFTNILSYTIIIMHSILFSFDFLTQFSL